MFVCVVACKFFLFKLLLLLKTEFS